jgi:hypothetical protein
MRPPARTPSPAGHHGSLLNAIGTTVGALTENLHHQPTLPLRPAGNQATVAPRANAE